MPFSRPVTSSIADDQTLAFFSSDGVLHVWDVETGQQQHQYLPSSHLTASFTCLSWRRKGAKKNKKQRKRKSQSVEKPELIALGTAVGEVVIYNALNGELVSKYDVGHSSQVNSIAWTDRDTFYSCSSDHHIIEWKVKDEKYKHKWKGDRWEIYSLCIGPHSNTLLSAGKTIRLWDLKTRKVLQKFSGHASPIISLQYLSLPNERSQADSTFEAVDDLYFVSAACEDRIVSAWQINSSVSKKLSSCSFSLPSEPHFLDILPAETGNSPAWLLSVTEDQQLALFRHTLNGHSEKPFQPCKTIKIVTEEAQPLKLICASFNKQGHQADKSVRVVVAYGSAIRVVFEQIDLDDHSESEIILIRKDPSIIDAFLEQQDNIKLREPSKSKTFSSVVPGYVGHTASISKNKRKIQPAIAEDELTLEERAIASSADVAPTKSVPRADSYAILLSQGLQSQDTQIINQVIQLNNDTLINNTVSQLPINYVVPLVKDLTERLKGHPQKCLIFIKWMKATLNHHSSFLTTLPDVVSLLNEVYQIIESRTRIHEFLPSAKGKLEMLLSQVDSRKQDKSDIKTENADAFYVYDGDSSDDYEEMDGVTVDDLDPINGLDDYYNQSDDDNKIEDKYNENNDMDDDDDDSDDDTEYDEDSNESS